MTADPRDIKLMDVSHRLCGWAMAIRAGEDATVRAGIRSKPLGSALDDALCLDVASRVLEAVLTGARGELSVGRRVPRFVAEAVDAARGCIATEAEFRVREGIRPPALGERA